MLVLLELGWWDGRVLHRPGTTWIRQPPEERLDCTAASSLLDDEVVVERSSRGDENEVMSKEQKKARDPPCRG